MAVCNDRGARREYIAALGEAMPGTTLHIVTIRSDTVDLLAEVERQAGRPPDGPVMLLGLEDAIPSKEPSHPILDNLNLRRPEWPERVPQPVVFWVADYLLGILGREAPDFFDWRSDTVFLPEMSTKDRQLLRAGPWRGGTDGTMTEQPRRARIKELQSRIKAAGTSDERVTKEALASWLSELGNHLDLLGDLEQAETVHRKALQIDEKLGRLEGVAIQYGNLGLIYQARGEYGQAEAMHCKAIEINEKLGRQPGLANEYGNLGMLYQVLGDLDKAEVMQRKALEINERLGRGAGTAAQYGNLGLICGARGDLDDAEAMHRKALEIHERLGRLEGMASDYGNLGLVYGTRGDLDQAEAMFRRALEINEKLGLVEGMAAQQANLGTIFELRSEANLATEYWSQARDLYTRGQMPHMAAKMQAWIDALKS